MISYKSPVFYLRHSNFMAQTSSYTEENIKSLDWKEHIRMRPGMYIGKLGDGNSHDDGIYVLLKEVLDNSMDEFVMGFGKTISNTLKKRIVEKGVKDIYICLDLDARKQALETAQYFMSNGLNVYFVDITGKDPSDLGFEKITNVLNSTHIMSETELMEQKILCAL